MKPTCIYCGSDSDLNTQLGIKLEDGTKVTVDICDEHAEEASVKTARQHYLKKQSEIQAFMEQAKALGLEFKEPGSGGGLVLPQQAPPPEPQPQPVQQEAPPPEPKQPVVQAMAEVDEDEAEEGWVSTAKVDAADKKGFRSVGGSGGAHGAVDGHSSYAVTGQQDVLSEDLRKGKVQMGVGEGRAGAPIAVPAKRVDGTGTTRIRIVKSESDQTLQQRFKNMAQDSQADQQPDFRNGYGDSTRSCPICRGECHVNGQDCPKCDGLGVISVY